MIETLWSDLGIGPWQAVALVVATTVLFWVFTGLMHFFGAKMRLRVSTASLALMTVIGAITARSILGQTPTLSAGIIALVVLFGWEWVLRNVSSRIRRHRGEHHKAWAVMISGKAQPENLATVGISEANLWIRLRRAGITELSEVRYAIIESDGSLTVIREGKTVDPEIITGIIGI